MNTIFTNPKISRTSDPHILLLNLTDKRNFKKMINMSLFQILACNMQGKIQKVI